MSPRTSAASEKFNWRRTRGAKLLLVAAGTVIALGLGELLIRVSGQAPDFKAIHLGSRDCVYRRSTNPVLGFELKRNFRHASPDLIQNYEQTNEHGQRDAPRTLEKPEGIQRVLLLGDSVVEGYGLPAEDTISNNLQALVGTDAEVLNFGVSAYCTLAEIELLATKGLKFTPDVVVLVFVENDFDNFNREAFPLGGTIERPGWTEWLFPRSDLFRTVAVQWNLFDFAAEVDPVAWNKAAIGDNNVVLGLERFSQLATEYQFQPLIAIWPKFLDDRIVDVHFVDEAATQMVVEHLAADFGLPTVRLSKYFAAHRSAQSPTPNPRLHYSSGDGLHPSAEGSRIAARAIHAALGELALGQLKPTPMTNGDAGDGIRAAQALGSVVPSYARVHLRLGNDWLKQQRFTEAIEEFNQAIAAEPENAGAYNNLGLAYLGLGTGDAEQAFRKAIECQPDFVHAHFNLARLLLKQNQIDAAIDAYRRTIELDPSHSGALVQLGIESGKKRHFSEARDYLERAVRADPNNPEAHNNLGVIDAATGRLEAALQEFAHALRIQPGHVRAKANHHRVAQLLRANDPASEAGNGDFDSD